MGQFVPDSDLLSFPRQVRWTMYGVPQGDDVSPLLLCKLTPIFKTNASPSLPPAMTPGITESGTMMDNI